MKGQIQDLAQAADTDAKADSVHNEQDNVVIERKNVSEKEEKHETTNISRPTFIAPGACLGSLNNMLKNKFWGCLRSDRLKNATRIHYETLTSFEGLRRKVRAEEYEMKIASGVQHQPMKTEKKGDREARTVEDESVLEQLLARITSLEKEVKQINRNRGNRFGRINKKKDFKQTELDNEKVEIHPKPLN